MTREYCVICDRVTEFYPEYSNRRPPECKVCNSDRKARWYRLHRDAVLRRQRERYAAKKVS